MQNYKQPPNPSPAGCITGSHWRWVWGFFYAMKCQIKRLETALSRIKKMDKQDREAGFATPFQMGFPELMRCAFAAVESGNNEAIEEGLAYAYLAGVIHTQTTNENHDN